MINQEKLNKLKFLGIYKTLHWKLLNFLGIKSVLKIQYFNKVFYVRTLSTDVEIILENLMEDYAIGLDLVDQDHKGIIVDAGGYIGSTAIIFAKLFPKAKIITLEPEINNFRILKKNIKPYKNILALNCALISTKKKLNSYNLYQNVGGECGFSFLKNNKSKLVQTKLKTISLDDIIKKFNKKILILKLDIEGYEKQLLEFDKKMLKKIKIIFIELHERIVKGCDDSFIKFSKNRFNKKLSGEKFLSAEVF